MNVACQAGHWNVINLLAKARGLQPEAVTVLGQILQTSRAPRPTDYEFTMALSEPSLLQSLLIHPTSCQVVMNYVRDNVDHFPVDILRRFAVQLDPSQPVAIPLVVRLFQKRKETTSIDSTLDSLDFDSVPQVPSIVREVIETFIYVLVVLVNKTEDEQIL